MSYPRLTLGMVDGCRDETGETAPWIPDAVADLSPKTKLCFRVIVEMQPISFTEVHETTEMSSHSVEVGLRTLEEEGVIESEVDMRDTRRCLYTLSDPVSRKYKSERGEQAGEP